MYKLMDHLSDNSWYTNLNIMEKIMISNKQV